MSNLAKIPNEVKLAPVKMPNEVKSPRIGIYAGTFDPIHSGHIAFALQSLEAAKLDAVYFLPERQPRYKHGVEHFGHRTAMITRALRPHNKLELLELPDKYFSITHTLPRLHIQFQGAQLVFLMGSDVVKHIASWPSLEQLFATSELCVGRRTQDSEQEIFAALAAAAAQPMKTTIIESYGKRISSTAVRMALYENRQIAGLLHSVRSYVKREWLYLRNSS
jgi:nicotinate-nucleotide adenylyltransferase